jgi:small-conductance mechanosensitive channel
MIMDAAEPAVRTVERWLEGFLALLPTLGVALIVFALMLGAALAAKYTLISVFRRSSRRELGVLLGGFVKWALILFGLLVVATIVFPSVKPADLLATLGIGSVAIGFAFKDILQNWLSGLLILYRQPFKTGDQIVSGGFEGTVQRIEARATLIRTYDGQLVVIPNSDIYTRAVTVRTAFPRRRTECEVGIGFGDDIAAACDLIVETLLDVEGVESHPTPEAFAWTLAGSSVNIKVRWWSDPTQISVVRTQGRVIAAIKNALSAAGIDLPYPTRVMLFHDQSEEVDGDRSRQREGWPVPVDGSRPPAAHSSGTVVECSTETANDASGSDPGFANMGRPRMARSFGHRGKDRT